ncbi:MAG: hypothetical protein PUK59_07160 [Actinomycetaceae bacterium]|nr:hypothetical protein [Actinomycetaceae bacterium]MDY5854934.1 hypothetical protein [Arcanobacterium sp.]
MSQCIKPGAPKYFTRRNLARPTLGHIVGAVSEAVRGHKLMPWQQYVINVAWELDPDHPGELFYKEGDVTVPRQAGKSDLLEAIHAAGAFMFKEWLSAMTAQTGKDAGKRWRALVNGLHLDKGIRSDDWKVNRGKGAEQAIYLPQSSSIVPFTPKPDALHGDHMNFASIDEEWAFSLDEGVLLETAIKPTFLTVPFSQLFRASTMGTANSTYMNYNIELGRKAVTNPDSRRFYFEWSADEEAADRDPYSDETLAFHPAIGHTQTARRIRDLGRDMPLGEWRRSFLNLATQTDETIIDLAAWDALRWNYDPTTAPHDRVLPDPSDTVLAWDAALDGTAATIYAAWLDTDTREPCVHLVVTQPGTDWLPGVLARLERRGYREVLHDDTGVNRTVEQKLNQQNTHSTRITFSEYATACQTLLDRIRLATIEHDGAACVIDAISVAAMKQTSRAIMFDTRKSAGNIDALRALAIAQDGAVRILSRGSFQLF